MSDGDRSGYDTVVKVVIGALVIFGLLYVAWQTGTLTEKYAHQANASARKYAYDTHDYIINKCLYAPEGYVECSVNTIKASEEYQTTQYDLAAQREMALWAFYMFLATVCSVVATIIGIVFVRRTFQETQKANRIARQTAIDDGQAYIQVEGIEVDWIEGGPPAAIVTVRNTGSTPAKWYAYRAHAFVSETPSITFDRTKVAARPMTKWYGFGASNDLTFSLRGEETKQAIVDADAQAQRVRIDGIIEYETFYGDVFISEFSFAGRAWPQQFRVPHMIAVVDRTPGIPPATMKLSRTTQELRCFYLMTPAEQRGKGA